MRQRTCGHHTRGRHQIPAGVVIALPRPCLCLVTDRRAVYPAARSAEDALSALLEVIDEAIAAGIDLIFFFSY